MMSNYCYPDLPEDDSSIEGDLDLLDNMNVHYDFSAWDSFHSSLSTSTRASVRRSIHSSLLVSFLSTSARTVVSDDEDGECKDDYNINSHVAGKKEDPLVGTSMELTDSERYDIEAWRKRLFGGSVFSRDYIPKQWERKEMEKMISFLELKNPNDHPEYLCDPEQQVTKKAISSIFFPEPGEAQSVLLKRGPVLVSGEEERELMLFTNGFVISRVELDTLVNILLGANDGTSQQNLTSEQLCERFNDIDFDYSGSLDRYELSTLFQGTGMTLSETSLDLLMKHFDSDSDGLIDLDEFKSVLCQLNKPSKKLSLGALGTNLRKALVRARDTRHLDLAFQMSDIEKIEELDIRHVSDFDKECAKLTFTLHLMGVDNPLVLTCSKPGHVKAWIESFRTCIAGLESENPPGRPSFAQQAKCKKYIDRCRSTIS